jgi:serine protease
LSGSGSSAPAGHAITGYQWTLTAGSNIASFTSATNAPRRSRRRRPAVSP